MGLTPRKIFAPLLFRKICAGSDLASSRSADPGAEFGPGMDSQLAIDPANIGLDRFGRQEEFLSDDAIRQAAGGEIRDALLSS
jgi:hypothetical protein